MRAFDQRFASTYNDIERFPRLQDVALELGCSVKTVKNRAAENRSLAKQGRDVPKLISRKGTGKNVEAVEEPQYHEREVITPLRRDAKKKGTKFFILSGAQDESKVHEGFMDNLEAYAKYLGSCEILIGGFTYNKSIHDDRDPRPQSKKTQPVHFHERVRPYLTHDQIELGENVVFCGEMNTLPTAVNPLSGFETYTRDKWGIFPHTKVQLQSIATAKNSLTKQLMSTGAVTKPNYVQKKAGIKASFHHVIGAVLVELCDDGSFFCRHLLADGHDDTEGGFYDLDRRVENGKVTEGHRVEGITYGDIHHEKIDELVAATTWGYSPRGKVKSKDTPLLDYLKPKHQFFHDLSDFSARNHHNIKDPHFLFTTHVHSTANVEEAMVATSKFMEETRRDWCRSVVVQSNHDNALLKWLKTADYTIDPENAVFFLRTQLAYYEALSRGISEPPIFADVLKGYSDDELQGVMFVAEDDSYRICGDIECAMHGHLGANGSRGSAKQYTKMGAKSNTGHTHSPQIVDGAYVSGVSGSLCMGYNKGLSSWAHAHTITYANGKRTIMTMMHGRWYAPHKSKRSKKKKA